LEFQAGETRLRCSFGTGLNEVAGNIDANNLGAQKGERNRCRAVSAAKIQDPQGPRHPEGLNDGFSRLTHEGGNPSKVTLLPQRFVRIHLYSFHSSCR
jgi:hypothetical protein